MIKRSYYCDIFKNIRYGQDAFCLLVLGIMIFIIYQKTFYFNIFSLDDRQYVFDNFMVLEGFNFNNFINAFKFINYLFWIPFTWISYMVDVSLFGADPGKLHRTSVILYIINVFLIYCFYKQFSSDVFAALTAASIYSMHPMRVESVVWIAQRKDILSGIFFVLSLIGYMGYAKNRSKVFYLASIVFAVAAVMSKPIAVVIGPAIIICELWRLSRSGKVEKFVDVLRPTWPVQFISVAGAIVTVLHRGSIILEFDLLTRIKIFGYAMFYFLRKTFLPYDLALLDKDIQIAAVNTITVFFSLVSLIIGSAVLYHMRRRMPDLFYGFLWYLITIMPSSGLLPTGNILWSDKFTYIPHIGLVLGVVLEIKRATKNIDLNRYIAGVAGLVSILALSAAANQYVAKWKDPYTYFDYVDSIYGKSTYTYIQRGIESALNGRYYESIHYFDLAETINPETQEIYYNRGLSASKAGEIEMAIWNYNKALELNPSDYQAKYNLELLLKNINGSR